jgi:hypothetical protein
MELINKRNICGVKDSINLYRIKNGIKYCQWISGRNMEDTKKEVNRLKSEGINCFRIGTDIFIQEDQSLQAGENFQG